MYSHKSHKSKEGTVEKDLTFVQLATAAVRI